jgi:hypothetical protein
MRTTVEITDEQHRALIAVAQRRGTGQGRLLVGTLLVEHRSCGCYIGGPCRWA